MLQIGVFFPKDRTYRAFFVFLHKINFFGMVPKGLKSFGSFVYAAESASLLFELLGRPQNGVFSTLSTKSRTFYTINFFF